VTDEIKEGSYWARNKDTKKWEIIKIEFMGWLAEPAIVVWCLGPKHIMSLLLAKTTFDPFDQWQPVPPHKEVDK